MAETPPQADVQPAPAGARARLEAALKARAGFLVDWLAGRGVKPNHVTLAGLGITLAAAPLIAFGWLLPGGLLFLIGSALDGLDGELARHDGAPPSPFGGVLDSIADRLGEGVAFAALAAHFAANALPGTPGAGVSAWAAAATVLALVGANLTSYVRARAEAAGLECRGGVCTRLERVTILGVGLLAHQPEAAIYLLIALTFTTVAQRLHVVRKGLA